MRNPLRVMVVTSPFGARGPVTLPSGEVRPGGEHNGVDLRATVGTPVLAPEAGTIDKINETARGGLQVFLRGRLGRWAFVHLSRSLVRVGDVVAEGTHIADTGQSGGVAPHLHLEVRDLRADRVVDPMAFLARHLVGGGGGGLVLLALAVWGGSRV